MLVFFAAVGICVLAAVYPFKDSSHAAGRLSAQGGSVRHAVDLTPGKRQYVVTVTGTVQLPYHGDARVSVEGQPELDYEMHAAGPVLDLGLHRKPAFRDGVLEHLEPQDRFALWVVMRPRNPDWSGQAGSHALRNTVTFRDSQSGRTRFQVPIVYGPNEETNHAKQH